MNIPVHSYDDITFETYIDGLPTGQAFTEMVKEIDCDFFKDLFVLLFWYEKAFEVLKNKAGQSLIERLKLFFFLHCVALRENVIKND